jgi:chromosome segregation ATPase
MVKKTSYNERDVEYWKRMSSRLAISIAVMLLAGGIVGSWMSSENRALDAFKSNNKKLTEAIANGRETLAKTTKEREAYKNSTEKLRERIAGLEDRLEHLRSEAELYDELKESKKNNKEVRDAILKLKVENADLKAQLDE